MALNKLVPGARYSSRAAREQRYRERVRAYSEGRIIDRDCTNYSTIWGRAAEALQKNDPTGSKLAALLQKNSDIRNK